LLYHKYDFFSVLFFFWKICFKYLLFTFSVLVSVESYTLTGLGDVSLPTDTPLTPVSIDDLSPISPSKYQPISTRRPSNTSTHSLKAFKRWLSSPVRKLSLGGGGKGQSSNVIQSPDRSGYMFLPLSPAQSPLSPTETSKKLPHSYRSLVCTSFTLLFKSVGLVRLKKRNDFYSVNMH